LFKCQSGARHNRFETRNSMPIVCVMFETVWRKHEKRMVINKCTISGIVSNYRLCIHTREFVSDNNCRADDVYVTCIHVNNSERRKTEYHKCELDKRNGQYKRLYCPKCISILPLLLLMCPSLCERFEN